MPSKKKQQQGLFRVYTSLTVVLRKRNLARNSALPRNHETYLLHALACMALNGIIMHGGRECHPMEADPMVRPGDTRDELWPSVAWSSGVGPRSRFHVFVDVEVDDGLPSREIIHATLRGIVEEISGQMPPQVGAIRFGRIKGIFEIPRASVAP